MQVFSGDIILVCALRTETSNNYIDLTRAKSEALVLNILIIYLNENKIEQCLTATATRISKNQYCN